MKLGSLEIKKFNISPVQLIVLSYVVGIIVAMILLALPVSLKEGVRLSFFDTLFTAVSAISVTGLTVVNTAETFTPFGVFVLMLVLQVGGIGLMTLGTFVYVLLGRNIGLSHRKLIMIDQNRNNLMGLVQTIKLVFGFALAIEVIGGFIFGTYFWITGFSNVWYEAYYFGFFHSLSAYTNAGFDIFGDSMYRFSTDYFVQTLTMVLIILGALGFPVLIEIRAKLSGKFPNFRFSLFTKLTTVTFAILVIVGALSFFLLERKLFLAELPWHEKLFHALFYSVTPRSGGLATLDVNLFSTPTLFMLSILMFIGASPSSVGGGVRTTTFAVVLLTIHSFARGKQEVRLFNRRLADQDIMKSFVVFSTAIMLTILSIIILESSESAKISFVAIIFEVCSAFGSSGLSLGITPDLSSLGKCIISFLMFLGRVGVLTFLLFTVTSKMAPNIHYPEERVLIG